MTLWFEVWTGAEEERRFQTIPNKKSEQDMVKTTTRVMTKTNPKITGNEN